MTLAGNGHTINGAGIGPVLTIASATTALIDGLTIRGGVAAECGGGIYSQGLLTVRHSHVHDNRASNGGGICAGHHITPAGLTLEDTVIAGNTADWSGGGIYAATGPIDCAADVCLVVNATDLTVEENTAGSGGGIYAGVEGADLELTIARSLLTRNRAIAGGALYNYAYDGHLTTTISRSAITANEATDGGGIYTFGTVHLIWYEGGRATLGVLNSTLSGNVADLGGGGAIAVHQSSPPFASPESPQVPPPFGGSFANVAFSTLSNNAAAFGGGIWNSGNLYFLASIIAGNGAGGDCRFNDDNYTYFFSYGYNLDGDGSCGLDQPGDMPTGVADLLPLAINPPGTTPTHALGAASQARDHIPLDEGDCSVWTPNPDQRGVERPQPFHGRCDIGAYEADD